MTFFATAFIPVGMTKLLTIIFALTLISGNRHDFHVSISEMERNASSGRLEIAVKIFTDDLEEAIARRGLRQANIGTAAEHDSAQVFIARYLSELFLVWNDGNPLSTAYLGSEQSADATWCYLESEPLKNLGQIRVRNTVLHEVFDDQVNIIHFKRDGKTKAKMTDRSSTEAVF